jgi:hypothetical protein
MSFPAVHNKAIWLLVLVYLCTMIVFGFLHSVLSVIFVVEGVISNDGVEKPIRTIPLSVVSSEFETCSRNLAHRWKEIANHKLTSMHHGTGHTIRI